MYSYRDLCQMSYKELRRLSILFRLPANIKKKHMILMIDAHQKGDGLRKTLISNMIVEERNMKRMTDEIKRKPIILSSGVRTHKVCTGSSGTTKHEIKTRYSYVARYTKGQKGSELSGIIREEAEVSRRNTGRIVQQIRKSTSKVAAIGRTEIMLPRNHSSTTLVQLMPQSEKSLMYSGKATHELTSDSGWTGSVGYESNSSVAASDENPFAYNNFHFTEECGDSFMSSTSYESYRLQPSYWPLRQYESFLRPSEEKKEVLCAHRDISSSLPLSDPYGQETNGDCRTKIGMKSYGSINMLEPSYEQQFRRFDPRHEDQHNENLTYLVDIFTSRGETENSEMLRQDTLFCGRDSQTVGVKHCLTESGIFGGDVSYTPETYILGGTDDSVLCGREGVGRQEEEIGLSGEKYRYSLSHNPYRLAGHEVPQGPTVLPSFMSAFQDYRTPEAILVEAIESPTSFSTRCGFVSGHEHPATMNRSFTPSPVAQVFEPIYSITGQDPAYSFCKTTFTYTTDVHSQPIVACISPKTSGYDFHQTERTWKELDVVAKTHTQQDVSISGGSLHHYQHSAFCSYPEDGFCASDVTTHNAWREYSESSASKLISQGDGHAVRVIQCKKHGFHYIYSMSIAQ